MMRTCCWRLFLFLGALATSFAYAAPSLSQQQTLSVAEAARRAREEKKNEPKAKVVWTNDNIPKTPGAINVVGQPGPPAAAAREEKIPPASTTEQSAAEQEKERAELESELARAKEDLANVKSDQDLLQRKFLLDRQQFYSKPDYSSDHEGLARMRSEDDQLSAKQQEVLEAERKVAELEAKLKSSRGPH